MALVVSAQTKEYIHLWLYALALAFQIEVQDLVLGDKAAEGAFHLMELITGEPDQAPEDLEDMKLDWEPEEQALPKELLYLWQKAKTGERLEVRELLEQVPKFKDIPAKAPENNHKPSPNDKQLRVLQNSLLHSLRLFGHTYHLLQERSAEQDGQTTFQQAWKFLADIYFKLEETRKESAIPGSTAASDQLFTKNDINNALLHQKIKGFRPFGPRTFYRRYSPTLSGVGAYSFRPLSAKGKSGGKSGFGFGYGSQKPTQLGRGFGYGSQKGGASRGYGSRGRGKGMPKTGAMPFAHFPSQAEVRRRPREEEFNFEPEGSLAMVATGQRCPDLGDQVNSGGFIPNPPSASDFAKQTPHQVSPGHGFDCYSGARIFGGGSSQGDRSLLSQASDSMVLDQENGRRQTEIETHCRLSRTKQVLYSKAFSHGPFRYHNPLFTERDVGLQSRPKACILPSSSGRKFETLPLSKRRYKSVPVSRSPLWDKYHSLSVDQDHASTTKNLEEAGYSNICLPRRHFGGWIHPQKSAKRSYSCPANTAGRWDASQHKKCVLEPTQKVQHLGFILDFVAGTLQVPGPKMASLRKEMGKVVKMEQMSVRKMASILGSVRACLPAVPFLRAFTDQMLQFVSHSKHFGWNKVLPVPAQLKVQLLEVRNLMLTWAGRPFGHKESSMILYSDSSQLGWAGVRIDSPQIIQDFWRDKVSQHINWKEIQAAMDTVRSFTSHSQKVTLCVDNVVTFAYLSKCGGRLPHLNALVRPFLQWCIDHKIELQLQLVKSQQCLADGPSRTPQDKGDYTLDKVLFQTLRKNFLPFVNPKVDMFATPSNTQLPQFVAKYPHWQAYLVDALKCPLWDVWDCYASPPWTIISHWLHRLRQNPHLTCLFVCPYWVSTYWWPLLTKLVHPAAPQVLVPPYWGMFQNCYGISMPPPRWPLLCVILSGKFYRGNKFRMKPLTLTWEE